MLRLAYEHGKLMRLPVIKKLKEAGARQGFFESEQYQAVRSHLAPDHLRAAVAVLDGVLSASQPTSKITQEITHEPVAVGGASQK